MSMRQRAQRRKGADVGVTDWPVATSSAVTSTSAKPSVHGGVGVAEVFLPPRYAATCTPPKVSIDVADFVVLAGFATTPMRPRMEEAGRRG